MILNIYKVRNWTSFDVVAKVRGMLGGKRKVGHAGTLDPLAEGVLILLTDEDTKRQNEFMSMDKEYVAKIAFGASTPTYDLEKLPDVSEKQMSLEVVIKNVEKILSRYIGEISQKVPSYSAVKVKGKTLYKEARKGKVVDKDLPVKRIKIYEIKILGSKYEELETGSGTHKFPVIEMAVMCSSGTYVRSLAHDLGEELGCGAVLIYLQRKRIGDFVVEESKKISDFSDFPWFNKSS